MNDGGRGSKPVAGKEAPRGSPAGGETGETGETAGLRPASHWFSPAGERVASEQPQARFARMREERQQIGQDLQRRGGVGPSVQLQRGAAASVGAAAGGVETEVAAGGVRGAGSQLPHGDAIQKSFGRHDVSSVQAHTGGAARAAAGALGAQAFATGQSIAFSDGAPSLHTAAHEAAHVVQQRAGVAPSGVGPAGGEHERHADAVADRVVRGKSSEKILDRMTGPVPRGAAPPSGAVQLMPITGSAKDSTVMTYADILALNPRTLSAVERAAIRTRLGQLAGLASAPAYVAAIHGKIAELDAIVVAPPPVLGGREPPPAAEPSAKRQATAPAMGQQPAPMQGVTGAAHPIATAAPATGPRLDQFHMSPEAGEVEVIVDVVNPQGRVGEEPRAPKTDGNAYVANIPTVGAGKDRTVAQVAHQYQTEAFSTPADAADRFGMVVGVNRMESIAESAAAPAAEVRSQAQAVLGFSGYRLAALGMLWRPHWLGPDGAASPEQVRNVFNAKPAEERRAHENAERGGAKPVPVGRIRDLILGSGHSTKFVAELQKKYQRAFIHVADSDAITLNVGAPLFNRYDQTVHDHRQAHGGRAPAVASGGYDFVQAGMGQNDPRMARNRQTVDTNQLDMGVRQATARVNPGVPYPPEPNMIVDAAQLPRGANFSGGRGEQQGKTNEATNLVRSMGGDSPEWMKQNAAFDRRATIQTDAGRFDNEYTRAGSRPNDRSATELFHPTHAAQSHARQRQLAGRIESVYRLAKAPGLYALLGCMLPQGLFDLTRDEEAPAAPPPAPTAATPMATDQPPASSPAAREPPRSPLDQARESLAHFGATAGALADLLTRVIAIESKTELDRVMPAIERDVDALIAHCRLPTSVKPKIIEAIGGVNLMRRGTPKRGARRGVAPVDPGVLREIIQIAAQAGAAIAEFLAGYREQQQQAAAGPAWALPNPMMVAMVQAMPSAPPMPLTDDAAQPPAPTRGAQQPASMDAAPTNPNSNND